MVVILGISVLDVSIVVLMAIVGAELAVELDVGEVDDAAVFSVLLAVPEDDDIVVTAVDVLKCELLIIHNRIGVKRHLRICHRHCNPFYQHRHHKHRSRNNHHIVDPIQHHEQYNQRRHQHSNSNYNIHLSFVQEETVC